MSTVNHIDLANSPVKARKTGTKNLQDNILARLARRVDPAWWKYFLVASDAILIFIGFINAYYIRYQLQWFRAVDPAFQLSFWDYTPFAFVLVLVILLALRFSGVYPYRYGRNLIEETYAIGTATTLGMVILIVFNLILRPGLYSRLIFLYTALSVTILLGLSRLAIALARRYLRQYGIGVVRVLLVGVGDIGRMVMRTVAARPDLGYQVVGFIDDNPAKGNNDIGRFKALGSIENFAQIVETGNIDRVMICLPWQSHRTIQRLLRICEQEQVRALVVPDIFQLTKNQLQVEELNGIPLLSTRELSIQGWNLFLKRLSDIVLAGLLGLFTLPFTALIALAIRLDSPGPIIYSQTRVGKNGKPFRCHKFRSMVDGAHDLRHTVANLNEASGPLFKVRDDPRQTRVGRFLRRFSLDELPQLYNVLRGEMSLIGPRPNLPAEVEEYQEWHKKRLAASPGMTGLWQVSGRSELTFDEMVLLDIYYVENWSLALDLGIFLRSIPAVLRGKGAY